MRSPAVPIASSSSSSSSILKRGPWTAEEDQLLSTYINREGEGRWRTLPSRAGLLRCGKSCRLRWMNYLRPSVKRGQIAPDEEDLILRLHRLLGNRWALIAGRISGRTDNEIKNYWNTHLSKKLIGQGIDPRTHKPLITISDQDQDNDHEDRQKSNPNNYLLSTDPYPDPDDLINISTDHIINNDDTFSSFFNSLINEDIFNTQLINQLHPIMNGDFLPNSYNDIDDQH